MATIEQWEALRKPFNQDEIEKLPKYTGKKTPDGKIPRDAYKHCNECGGYHPFPCVHLDYVGHAGITDRLNDVDPEWNWEPAALDNSGMPIMQNGGMWIKMTVLGVTRWAFGDAQGKTGPNAVKEVIGDAIRNGAMRFGVATYLWSKSDKADRLREYDEDAPAPPAPPAPRTGRFDRIGKLKARALELGIKEEGIKSWLDATFSKPMKDFADAEIRIAEEHIASLIKDKETLMAQETAQ